MIMVAIEDPNEEITGMFKLAESIKVSVGSPDDDSFRGLFRSVLWNILMRVLVPLFASGTLILQVSEAAELFSSVKAAGVPIQVYPTFRLAAYVVEAPVVLLMSIFYVGGHMGRMMIPINMHMAAWNLFTCSSILMSSMVALFMYEENRVSKRRLPRRCLWKQ